MRRIVWWKSTEQPKISKLSFPIGLGLATILGILGVAYIENERQAIDRQPPSDTPSIAIVSQTGKPAAQSMTTASAILGAIALDQKEQVQVEKASSETISSDEIWRQAAFPLETFEAYTSLFGVRHAPDGTAAEEFHYGLDLAAPEGSYIRSWWAGRVIEVSDDTACGTSVKIQSGDWEHTYCHMIGSVHEFDGERYLLDLDGRIQLKEGQEVPTGGRIGRVGMTGRTTGPHLHWSIKYGSDWIDPGMVLQVMYEAQQASQ